MNISSGKNSRNKKNPFEYIVPPPSRGSEQLFERIKYFKYYVPIHSFCWFKISEVVISSFLNTCLPLKIAVLGEQNAFVGTCSAGKQGNLV